MIAACSTAIVALVPVALFQCGVVDHLPDPPFSLFASDHITSSKAAHPLGIPDSLLGLASYGATLALALGAPDSRLARKALSGKLLLDGGMATFNAVKQFAEFKRACSWCMLTAAATAVMIAAGRKYLNSPLTDEGDNLRFSFGETIRK
jgi:uncharacterized membrane protein